MSKETLLRHRSYSGSAEVSIEDDCLHGRVLHIDDVITYEGQTVKDLARAFQAAVDEYLTHCAGIGKDPNKPYGGTLNVRLGSDRHRRLAEVGGSRGVNLNTAIVQAVDMAVLQWSSVQQVVKSHAVTSSAATALDESNDLFTRNGLPIFSANAARLLSTANIVEHLEPESRAAHP